MNYKKITVKHIIILCMLIHTALAIGVILGGSYIIIKQNGVQVDLLNQSLLIQLGIFVILVVVGIGYVISVCLYRFITKPIDHFIDAIQHFQHKKTSRHLLSINKSYLELEKLKNALLQIFNHLKNEFKYLQKQSFIDPLTGIGNRRVVDDILNEWIRENKSCTIIMLDLDYFKKVNDTKGHVVGDLVLQFLVEQMNKIIRECDISCRYGGEEFLILLPNTTVKSAYEIAEKLRCTMAATNSPCGYPVTLSAGVAAFPNHNVYTSHDLLKNADEALYKAKKNGRNLVQIAE